MKFPIQKSNSHKELWFFLKKCIPFFGTCCNLILQAKPVHDTKHCRKRCVYSSIIIYLPSPAKQRLVKEKKKTLQNCTNRGTNYINFLPLWFSFLYAKKYKLNQEVSVLVFFFSPEENNKGEQNHLLTIHSV